MYVMGKRYCVIFYNGHFQYHYFGRIYIQSLIYTLMSLFFNPNYFPRHMSPYVVEHAVSHGWRRIFCEFVCKIILPHNLMYQSEAQRRVPVLPLVMQGDGKLSSVDHVWEQYCDRNWDLTVIQPRTYKMSSSIFAAMSWLKFASTARSYLPSMASTEITNRETCFHWVWQCLPCLSLLIFSHQSRSAAMF